MMTRRLVAAAALAVSLAASPAWAEPDTFGLGNAQDGNFVAPAGSTVINSYAQLTAPAAPGDTTLTVSGTAGFAVNDLVMVWQSTGVVPIPLSGTPSPFDITNNAVGNWELARVKTVAATTLTLTNPLVNSFAASVTQVIEVPEYGTVTIAAGRNIVAPAWNGSTGGIVAFLATGVVTNAGSINVSALGFRPGTYFQDAVEQNGCNQLDGANQSGDWANKGEGIANTKFGAGNNGRGNVANGGGGGDCNGSGGAGGGNGGQGGGGGTDTTGAAVGGMGGSALTYSLYNHMTFGGGGGAGQEDDYVAPIPTAWGGGAVFIRAAGLAGAGAIRSNGGAGNTLNADGSPGGGAGGMLYLRFSGTITCGAISAAGGNGGNQNQTDGVNSGPGGGGAGGQLLLQYTTITGVCPSSVAAGTPGTSPNGNNGAGPTGGTGTGVVVNPPGGFTTCPTPVITVPVNNAYTVATPAFTGTDTLNGSTVKLFIDGSAVPSCTSAVAGGAWNCTAGAALTAGAHTAVAIDFYLGVQSFPSATVNFTVRTVVPLAPVISAPVSGSVVNTSTPTFNGTGEAGALVKVLQGAVTLCSAVVTGAGTWSCASGVALLDGPQTVTATQTNVVGTSPASGPDTFYVRTLAPPAPTITTPAPLSTVNNAKPTFFGTGEPGDTLVVTEGATTLCTTTVNAAGGWSCISTVVMADGSHTVSATASNGINPPATSASDTFYIRTVAPPPPAITSPVANSVINVTNPTFQGTGQAGDTLIVTEGATLLCSTTVTAAGTWSCASGPALAQGANTVVATEKNGVNPSGVSPSDTFYVRTQPPSQPAITTPASGSIVNSSTPAFSGTGEAGDTLVVSEGVTALCTTTVTAAGTWTCVSGVALADGPHTAVATATNGIGPGVASAADTYWIRTAPPPVPLISAPLAGSILNNATPAVSGTGEPGDVIAVNEAGTTLCTTQVTAAGNWSCTSSALVDGLHTVTATATNGVNPPAVSAPDAFYVRTAAPTVPLITAPAPGSTVNSAMPAIQGTGEAGDALTVREGATTLCSTVVTAAGTWSCTSAGLTDGLHTVVATAVNGVNPPANSAGDNFYVRTQPPVVPVFTAPSPGSVLNTATPTFSGTGEAGDVITVQEGGTTLCTATVSAAGTWTCIATSPLIDGSNTVLATATNGVNPPAVSATDTFFVFTQPPPAPIITAPAANSIVNTPTPTISGSGQPGDTVTVTEGGTTLCTAAVLAGNVWSCTSSALADGAHTVVATASNGVPPNASSGPDAFWVRTAAPPVPVITGPAANSNVYTATPAITGTGEPGDILTVTEGGTTVCATTVDATGAWTCTPGVPLADGAHTVVATATNGVNPPGVSAGDTFFVRTQPPAAPTFTAPAPNATVNISTPTFSGTAEPNATVSVSEGGTVLCTAIADASGNWSCTSTVSLVDGAHAATATATNGLGTGPASSPDPFWVRTQPPGAPVITGPVNGSTVNNSQPAVSGTAEPGSTVTVTEGAALICTATADPVTGAFSCTAMAPLADGSHTVTATAANGIGSGPASAPDQFWVRTMGPAAPVILVPANNAVVNTANPTLSGTAEPNANVTVSEGAQVLCVATADSVTGAWSCSSSVLADGKHTITATATNFFGTSAPSNPDTFWVRTQAPGAPVIAVPANGSSTNNPRPTISGTAEPGSMVTVLEGAATVCTATADPVSGAWSCAPATGLTPGMHTVTATATNGVGTGPASAPDTFTLVTMAPAAPVILSPVNGSIIATRTPVVFGTAQANATVNLTVDGAPVGSTAVDTAGNWGLLLTSPLADGVHTASATATDAANNVSPASPTDSFTVLATVPGAPVITMPTSGATTNGSPTIAGTALPNSTVNVYLDGVLLGVAQVDPIGNWSFPVSSTLSNGAHTATATDTDASGVTGPVSNAVTFTVSTTLLASPVIVSPVFGSIITNRTPTVIGTAPPNTTVQLSIDGVAAGTVSADANGNWTYTLTPAQTLMNGPHTAVATDTDSTGNTSLPSLPDRFSVLVQTPAAPSIISPPNGSTVNTSTPIVIGVAQPNMTIAVTLDGVVVGFTPADANGNWALALTSPLANGSHTATATATDAAGNVSAASNPDTFTVSGGVLTVNPPVIAQPVDGSFISTGTPVISGTAQAGSTVTVSVDGAVLGTPTATAAATFSYSLTAAQALASGRHRAVATATVGATTSPPSNVVSFTVLLQAPAAPVILIPADGTVVFTATPTVSGTSAVGTTVSVSVDAMPVGVVATDSGGHWAYALTLAQALTDGAHTATATATDAAGNASAASNTDHFTVDTRAPVAPVIVTPPNGSTVSVNPPAITGTAEALSTVDVSVDGTQACSIIATAGGMWECVPNAPFAVGSHTITATSRNPVGSSPATTSTFLVAAGPNTDGGINGDGGTNLPSDFTFRGGGCGCSSGPADTLALCGGALALLAFGARRRRARASALARR